LGGPNVSFINGVVNTLIHRSYTISDQNNFAEERKKLEAILRANGFDDRVISRTFNKVIRKNNEIQINTAEAANSSVNDFSDQKKAFLPYIKGTTDRIGNILRKFQIRTIFSPHVQIKHLLKTVKDRTPLQVEGVYRIPCQTCGKNYIGETGRSVKTRLEEHERAIRLGQSTKSAVAEHAALGHTIDLKEAKIVAKVKGFKQRLVREAIEISKEENNNFNRDTGLKISRTWQPVIGKNNRQPTPPTSHSPPPTT
jgi:hypothetical protein